MKSFMPFNEVHCLQITPEYFFVKCFADLLCAFNNFLKLVIQLKILVNGILMKKKSALL